MQTFFRFLAKIFSRLTSEIHYAAENPNWSSHFDASAIRQGTHTFSRIPRRKFGNLSVSFGSLEAAIMVTQVSDTPIQRGKTCARAESKVCHRPNVTLGKAFGTKLIPQSLAIGQFCWVNKRNDI